jgi:hypothetical protein
VIGQSKDAGTILLIKTGDEKCDHVVTETLFITSFY